MPKLVFQYSDIGETVSLSTTGNHATSCLPNARYRQVISESIFSMLYKAYVKPNSIVSTMTKQILLDSLLQEVGICCFESLFCVTNLSVWIQYHIEGSIILILIINYSQEIFKCNISQNFDLGKSVHFGNMIEILQVQTVAV